jgi:hypothetical protein
LFNDSYLKIRMALLKIKVVVLEIVYNFINYLKKFKTKTPNDFTPALEKTSLIWDWYTHFILYLFSFSDMDVIEGKKKPRKWTISYQMNKFWGWKLFYELFVFKLWGGTTSEQPKVKYILKLYILS